MDTLSEGMEYARSEDYGQVDRDYWNDKYDWGSVPECEIHGDTQYYNAESGEWECYDCIDEEDMQNG